LQLEVVGRIGEDEVDAALGQGSKQLEVIAVEDGVQGEVGH
jgi:hypothetical protein